MAEGSRGPIKVGTGYVEIIPKVLQKDMEEMRRKVQREMQALGAKAARDISEGAKKGLAALPAEVDKAARKANESTKKRKKESAKDLKRIEEQITREYGEEAAKRWRAFRDLEQKKEKALKKASSATKAALRETVRQEEQAARQRQAAAERLEKDRLRLMRKSATDHARLEMQKTRLEQAQERLRIQALRQENRTREIEMREASRIRMATMREETARYRAELQQQTAAHRAAMRAQVQAQRDAVRQQVAALREQAAAQRAALQDGIAVQQRRMTVLRDQVRDINRDINATNTTTQSYFTKTGTALRRMGTWFDQVGTSINEAANILQNRFLMPLAGAGALLTTVGVENADKRLLGQLGLTSAGVSKSASAEQMRLIQEYAIDTPFSIDVMHEYQMKLIRSVAGTDKNWYSKNAGKRTTAANNAAAQTTDLIMAIGDSMARAGNLNPQQFQRAMYAMDMIMDMDRAPTKNVKQLAAASGMPASELAALLGFKNSTEMWTVIGTPAKDGGGVTGRQIMDAMLNYWSPDKYKKGTATSDGSKGFAATMTSQTITGRLQQMKERASFELGNMFVEEGKDGTYSYTPLGEKLMGKQVPLHTRNRYGEVVATGEFATEGGILNQVQDLAKKWAPKIDGFLTKFFDSGSRFLEMLDWAATALEDSGFSDLAGPIADFLIKWGPLILAVGLLSKLLGKAGGLVGRAFTPVAAVTRAGVRTYEGQRDIRSQRRAARDARREARSDGASRREARQAGREAYRQQRTTNRNGDSRSPARRVLDGFMGRDSRVDDGQRELRALEAQIREARDEATSLRTELREANRESMRQITAALAGNGSSSVQGSAQQAGQAVNNVQQQAQQANNASLDHLRQEVEKVEAAARDVVSRLGTVKSDVDALNGKNLNAVTAEFDQLKSAAQGAGKEITSDNTRVGNLDGKRVSGVTGSINDLRDSAKQAADQIGDGAMSSSTSGRVSNLNKRRLTDIVGEFRKLTGAADDAYKMVGQGTGAGSLAGRIGLLNGRSLKDITDKVKNLEGELKGAKGEAEGLDTALGNISKRSPGGGSGSGGKGGKKNARGGIATQADVSMYGVMPGYAPWVDNIPAILSPGEAVLRPEVTQAIGPDTINSWNALAIRGKISRHARGTGAGGQSDLSQIRELMDLQNLYPVGTAMLKTMRLDGSSDPLGGGVQSGILRTGDHSAGIGGSVGAQNFRGMYDWMTGDVFDFLKRVPTIVGQAAGILGGALAPVQADYFWNDVWKGNGNIVERGQTYLSHLFSTETMGKVWDNLWGGVTDSVGAIWDVVTSPNPIEAFGGAFDDIGGVVSGSYNNLIGMIETVKEVKDAPMAYAGRVYGGFMANAQESMPNTKGLFDFKDGAKVSTDVPDFDSIGAPVGKGGGAEKWRLVAAQALQMLGLPGSALGTVLYRIGMESGGDPNIVNKWDSNWQAGHPSVGLMQVIGPTFDAYAGMFRNTGPKLYGTSVNPLANIYAGLNYARNRYGSGWQRMLAGKTGYATGTMSASPGLAMVGEKGRELVAFGGGERVFNNQETEALLNGKKYEIHVHEARNEPTPQAVLRALQTAEALYTTL
ncbi:MULTISPECIES: transglycosylase SLT domain-containing protein [unclassified Streptomyces]|uniref:transglycosylase SLT domain-containing protein n=1 Tax=unclassified Streptomyces TaxID=2593676 RepID=UPI0035D5C1FB